MNSELTHIYTLSHPITDEVRYVGKSDNVHSRFLNHKNAIRYKKDFTHKEAWIKSLEINGLLPKIYVVDTVLKDDWEFWEKHYISLFKTWGFKLTNSTDGGDGHKKMSSESRKNYFKRLKDELLSA